MTKEVSPEDSINYAKALEILHESHYKKCRGDHKFPSACDLYKAWLLQVGTNFVFEDDPKKND